MKLINDYKLVYEKGVGEAAQIYASKNRIPEEGDHTTVPNIGSYPDAKLFYEKDNQLFVSNSKVPTGADQAFAFMCDGEAVLGEEPAVMVARLQVPEENIQPVEEKEELEPSESID